MQDNWINSRASRSRGGPRRASHAPRSRCAGALRPSALLRCPASRFSTALSPPLSPSPSVEGVLKAALVQTAGSGPAMMSAELPEGGHGQADGRRATVRGSPLRP